MANEATEWTLCIIKPDAVSRKHQAQILQRIIDEDFEIVIRDIIPASMVPLLDGSG